MNYESMTDRELDALVAKAFEFKVGWLAHKPRGMTVGPAPIDDDWTLEHAEAVAKENGDEWIAVPLYSYSGLIGRAFDVVEAMRERGFDEVAIKSWEDGWLVTFWDGTLTGGAGKNEYELLLPRAICAAALRALDA